MHINLVLVLLLLHGGIHAQPVGCLWVEHEQWAFHAASKNVPFRNGIIGWMEVSVDRRRWVGFTTSLWRLARGDCDFRCVVICQNNHSCVYPHRNCILNIFVGFRCTVHVYYYTKRVSDIGNRYTCTDVWMEEKCNRIHIKHMHAHTTATICQTLSSLNRKHMSAEPVI